MKKSFLFLILASAYFTSSHALDLPSFDEWQPDPQTKLIELLLETHQALTQPLKKEEAINYSQLWHQVAGVLFEQDSVVAFNKGYADNFRRCNLKSTAPIHLCFGFDRVDQVTPQAFQERFTFLTNKESNQEQFRDLASEIYLRLFEGDFIVNPNRKQFLKDINSDDSENFKRAAEYIREIVRQTNYLRNPFMLELAKAYAVSQEALIHKITEYQQAAKELRLDRNGTYCIIEAFLTKAGGENPDCLPELLTHISSRIPEEHHTWTERAIQWFNSWFTTPSDTTQQAPDTEQATE